MEQNQVNSIFNNTVEANYLPLQMDAFIDLFGDVILHNEIEACYTRADKSGVKYVIAYIMRGIDGITLYQSSNPDYMVKI